MRIFGVTTLLRIAKFLAGFCVLLMISATAYAATGVPTIISYQGRLADSSGNLLGGNGTTYYFKFSIWDNATVGNGSKLWPSTAPSTTTLSVRQGVFNVNIGDTANGYPDTLNYNFNSSNDAYLQIEVSADNVTFQTLAPRQRITASPFARLSGAVSGADFSSAFGTTTAFSGAQINVEATSTNSILMALRARTSQVADLFQAQDSSGATLFSIDKTGTVFSNSSINSSSTLNVTGLASFFNAVKVVGALNASSTLVVTGAASFFSTFNVTGQTTLANASTTNLTASALFGVSGTSTLATTTVTQFTATGQSSFANASTTNLTINGIAYHIGDILPTTDVARSIGSTALRFLNLFVQNASTTNITASGLFGVTGTSTLATTTATQFTASGQTTLANASSSNLTVNGVAYHIGDILPTTDVARSLGTSALRFLNLFVQNASTTNISATGNAYVFGTSTFATTTVSQFIAMGQTTLGNASSSALTLGTPSSATGRLYIGSSGNAFLTQLISSSTQASSVTFTLPGNTGSSGDVLKSDGNGMMYWGTASGGALSGGTNGYLARWTSPSTLSTGLFIDNGSVAGINATSTSYTFNVQGSVAVNPFNVASSTGASLLSIDQAGKLTFTNASTTGNLSIGQQLFVTGTSTFATTTHALINLSGDILPTSDIARSLGSTALRFLSLFVQNASTTNMTASGLFGVTGTSTLATTTVTQLGVNGALNASSTLGVTGSATLYGALSVSGQTTLGNASTTALSASTHLVSPVFTGTGAVSLSSGGSSGLTLDSASGRVTINTGDFLKLGVSGTAGAAAGDIWYDTSDSKFKINENGSTKILCNLTDTGCGAGGSGVSLAPAAAQTDSTSNSSIFINKTTTSGNFLQLQQGGLDRFVVGNGGGIGVYADTMDINKTTTGTTRTQDFSVSGSTFQNVTSLNDQISIDDGTITLEGSIAASSPAVTTQAAIGRGSIVIYRDDGKYIIIHGNSTTGVSIWDGVTTGAMSAASTVLNAAAGYGAIALKRPDGRYLVVHAGGSAGTTSLYDPFNIQATAAGPAVCAGSAITSGTNAILRDDGKYLIMCGGFSSTSIYDPTANTVTVGPTLSSGTFGSGAHALLRPDGTYLIFKGGNTSGTAVYNPISALSGTTQIGTMTDVTITNAPTIATSSLSLRLQDGTFMVIPGTANTSSIYDPKGTSAAANGTFTTLSGAGNGPSATLQEGSQLLWRQDGNYLLLIGSGSAVTNVLKPGAASGSKFVTTNAPSLSASAGAGLVAFLIPDGKYAVLRGGGTGIDYYDMGFVMGGKNSGTGSLAAYWESECISSTGLSDKTVLSWHANAEGSLKVEYRMVTSPSACSTGTYATTTSGDTLKNYASGNDSIQMRVTFKRNRPVFVDQEWGIVKQNQTRYRRVNADPALYDINIQNSLALHRTQFDFGDSTATSGPVSVNISNDKNNSLAIALEAGIGYGSTVSSAANGGGIYNGAFGVNSSLTTTATSGTIIMRRPDNKFVVISGNTTANAQLYDSDARTFTALGTTPAAGAGIGAVAFKRPDGKYFIVLGNNTTTTSIFDPVLNTFTAGPTLTAAAGVGAQVIPLPNGRVLIIHGNLLQTTSIYDPVQNIMSAGPLPSTVVGPGSIVIPRPDGKYFFIPGMITANCTALNTVANIFDPYTMTFTNINTPGLTGTGPGAFAFQRKDGLWVIVRGGSTITTCAALNATHIYNPSNNKLVAGPNLSAAAQLGGGVILRPDGRPLIVHGGGLTSTSIYVEDLGAYTADIGGPIGAFIAGPTLQAAVGAGSVAFQKSDGKFTLINGGAVSTTQLYDGGWVNYGIYKTEYFNLGSKLSSSSVLTWRANSFTAISAEVKTAASEAAMQSAQFRELPKPGSRINPSGGDTYLQINFNFSRSFPMTNPINIYRDVWINGGGALSTPYYKVDTPTLYEYKVTNDADLIDLQSDGLSVFRVSSSGDVYTQVGATMNTSGADLAERYTSSDQLEKGEVVSIDPRNDHGVLRSSYQYQPDVIGVVSTDPGFVTGAYTEDSYPIALVGRVPVKVSTENGMIRSGDFLTTSSVPGYAMKATLAGRVIGKALETLDAATLTECPDSQFVNPNRKCGTIMMFVNLIDYQGQSIELSLADWKSTRETAKSNADLVGLSIEDDSLNNVAGLDDSKEFSFGNAHSEEILTFLNDLKKEREQGIAGQSELFTDRISATGDIISPHMVTSLIESTEGRFGSISGLTLSVDSVETKTLTTQTIQSSLMGGLSFEFTPAGSIVLRKSRGLVAGTSTDTLSASSTAATSTDDSLLAADEAQASSTDIFANASTSDVVVSFDPEGNAYFAGEVMASKITSGALSVTGKAVFDGGLEVATIGNASTTLNMFSDTFFFGRPYFTSDTGGTALIQKGAQSVDIVFEREYIENPIVNASVVFTSTTTADIVQQLFANDIRFIVGNRTTRGFTIFLNKKADDDIAFNWVALAVKDSKEFTSKRTIDEGSSAAVETLLRASTTTEENEPEESHGFVPLGDSDPSDSATSSIEASPGDSTQAKVSDQPSSEGEIVLPENSVTSENSDEGVITVPEF